MSAHGEHKARHIELHKALDELLGDWMAQTKGIPSEQPVIDFVHWSYEQTINPTDLPELPGWHYRELMSE